MTWIKYDGSNKYGRILPPPGQLVWIYTLDDEVDLGYWDSGWWCYWNGSDDVCVAAWHQLTYIDAPEWIDQWIKQIQESWEND